MEGAIITPMSGTTKVKGHRGIYRYLLADGKARYAAVATVDYRQLWSRRHTTIREAEVAREELRGKMRAGDVGKAAPAQTIAGFLQDTWLPELAPDLEKGSLRAYRVNVDRIVKAISDRRLRGVKAADLTALKTWLAEQDLASSTRYSTYMTFMQALGAAERTGLIGRHPGNLVKAPKKGRYKAPQLTTEQAGRLVAVADRSPFSALVYLAIATGIREEKELFALRWPSIDLSSGVMSIEDSKSPSGERAIALGPLLLERLRTYRLAQLRRIYELTGREDPPERVFVNRDGRPMRQSAFWRHWDKIRTEAGLPDLHFHDLRHVHSTLLARANVHPAVMQHRLGHADAKMTLAVYTQTNAKDQEEGAAAVELMLAGIAKDS